MYDGHTMVDDVMVGDDGRGDPAYAGVGQVPADGKPSAVQVADGKPSAKPDKELARRADSLDHAGLPKVRRLGPRRFAETEPIHVQHVGDLRNVVLSTSMVPNAKKSGAAAHDTSPLAAAETILPTRPPHVGSLKCCTCAMVGPLQAPPT